MVRGLASIAVVAVGLASGTARAQDASERVSLRYSAPDVCPDDAELVRAVEGFLGQPLAEGREQRLSVTVNVQGNPGSFSAKLSFKSPQGTEERFLEHPDCSKLTQGVALLAALAIDPERVKAHQAAADAIGSAKPAPTPAPELKLEPPPHAPPATERSVVCPEPRKTPPPEPTSEGTLSVAAFLGVGTLPGATPGVATEAGLRVRRFRVALVGRYWLNSSADVTGGPPSSIELSLATMGLRACVLPAVGAWSWLVCAGADLGDMAGSGQGVDNAHTRHALLADAEASLSLAYTRSRVAPFVSLGASVGLARPRFGVVRNSVPDETFQPSQLGVLASVGVACGL